MEASVSTRFPSARLALVAYDALRVDPQPARSGVTRTLRLKGEDLLEAKLEAAEAKRLRVALNGYLDALALVAETMQEFDGKK